MIFALILHHNGADLMKLDILAAFHTNSRRLIRIWRSWGLVGAKKRKQGAAQVVLGVRQICKNMKIGKKLENGLGVVGGGLDWCKMISAVVGTFLNGFWPRIH